MINEGINISNLLFEMAAEYLGAKNQTDAAKFLNVQQAQLSTYRINNNAGENVIKKMIESFAMSYSKEKGLTDTNAIKIIADYVTTKNLFTNQSQIADYLCISQGNFSSYLGKNNAGQAALKKILHTLINNSIKETVKSVINPVIEFKRIKPEKYATRYLLLPNENKKDQLKELLEKKIGVYLFYNSQGKNFYIGKTEKDLYNEITQQLGRKITFYNEYITKSSIPQGDVVHYLSVYQIKPKELIKNVEALLIRSYANDNTNIKMENFLTVS